MTFQFLHRPFWGLLVMNGGDYTPGSSHQSNAELRPRLDSRWERGPDGRLEWHWYRRGMRF